MTRDEPPPGKKPLSETFNDAFVIAAMIGLGVLVLVLVWYGVTHNT